MQRLRSLEVLTIEEYVLPIDRRDGDNVVGHLFQLFHVVVRHDQQVVLLAHLIERLDYVRQKIVSHAAKRLV